MLNKIIGYLLWRHVKHQLAPLASREAAWRVLLEEIEDTPLIVANAVEYQRTATERMAVRLTRRFDPGLALNEAYNAALERKKTIEGDPDPVRKLTPSQQAALKHQTEVLQKRLKSIE